MSAQPRRTISPCTRRKNEKPQVSKQAQEIGGHMVAPNYIYRCKVTRVVDGDTVDADIDLGFNMIYKERIRLMGIDTPESRTRNKRERPWARPVKPDFKSWLKATILVSGARRELPYTYRPPKRGRANSDASSEPYGLTTRTLTTS